jgi:hypothetical protein
MNAEVAGAIAELGFRPEFLDVLKRQAEAEADVCAALFQLCGLRSQDDVGNLQPVKLPLSVLLGFKLLIRLALWELNGIQAHIEAGMPTSQEVAERLFPQSLSNPEEVAAFEDFIQRNSIQSIHVLHDSTLWSAADSGVSLNVDFGVRFNDDDEELLELMADFLLKHCAENCE